MAPFAVRCVLCSVFASFPPCDDPALLGIFSVWKDKGWVESRHPAAEQIRSRGLVLTSILRELLLTEFDFAFRRLLGLFTPLLPLSRRMRDRV